MVSSLQQVSQEDLAKLEGAMLETYKRELGLNLNSPARLEAVYGSHFFDADRQGKLESVCKAAALILECETAAVNMITATGQIQVASSDHEVQEVPVEDGYCQHVVGLERDLTIEDGLRHALVCESRATTERGARSYLGVPLISDKGHIIGSLCCWSRYPRTWKPAEVMVLAGFAAVVMRFEDI